MLLIYGSGAIADFTYSFKVALDLKELLVRLEQAEQKWKVCTGS